MFLQTPAKRPPIEHVTPVEKRRRTSCGFQAVPVKRGLRTPVTPIAAKSVPTAHKKPGNNDILRWAHWKHRLRCKPGGIPAWLTLRVGLPTPAGWGVGCKFCSAAGCKGRLAKFAVQQPLFCNLVEHQKGAAHHMACKTPLQPQGAILPAHAPSKDEFASVWDFVVRHHSHGRDGIPGIGTWRKTRRMEWCLAEARRVLDRHFMSTATVASLMQDGRGNNLLIRLVATNTQLEVRRFVMGLERDCGSGAVAVRDATVLAMRRFCTRNDRPPPRTMTQPDMGTRHLDTKLFGHIKHIIEVFVADAAGDEQVAGRELQGSSSTSIPTLPNLHLVLRDKAHAARRVTSRPWKAGAFNQNVAFEFVWKRHSITNLIQHSHIFKSWFVTNETAVQRRLVQEAQQVQAVQAGEALDSVPILTCASKDLQLAKQRFDSTQKPMGRFCLSFEAIVLTSMQIATRRAGKPEGKAAVAFLHFCSDLEHVVQMGMLADAGDEGMMFTRFCDSEVMDLAMVSYEIRKFLHRIKVLFIDGQAVHLGYTKVMLTAARAVKLVILPGSAGTALTVGNRGGVPQQVVQRCLKRMAGWVALVAKAIASEFPSYEVVQSFSVFNLSQNNHDDPDGSTTIMAKHLQRLAKVLGQDANALHAQWVDHRPLARKHFTLEGCTFLEAWKRAINKTQQKHNRNRHPSATLLHCLQRYAAYTASSSGVEQTFARALKCCDKQRIGRLSNQAELDNLTLTLDAETPERDQTLELARAIWHEHYGSPIKIARRTSFASPSSDNIGGPGGHGDRSVACVSEAAWVRQRRTAVTALTRADTTALDAREMADIAVAAADDAWTARHDKEFTLQDARDSMWRAEAAAMLLPDETTQETQLLSTRMKDARMKAAQTRDAKEQVLRAVFQRPAFVFAQRRVHVGPGVSIPGNVWVNLRMRHCTNPVDADMFVVHDPVKCGALRKLAAALAGGCICTPLFITSNGSSGCNLVYHNMLKTQRFLWLSRRFQVQQPHVVQLLRHRLMRSGWRLLDTCAAFLARSRTPSLKAIALVTVEDKAVAGDVLTAQKNVFCLKEFVDKFAHINSAGSALGLGDA